EAGAITNTAISWDPVGNTWSYIDPMPLTRARMEGGGTANGMFSLGGAIAAGSFVGTQDNQRYLPVNCAFSPTNTPVPVNTNTRTITPTRTATFTATPTASCPPVLRIVGRGN